MCIYLSSEVILANLLSCNNSVSMTEVELYCDKVRDSLSDINVYINLNDRLLDSVLVNYEREFRRFQDRFFTNEKIDLHQFNERYDSTISSILSKVACMVQSEEA